MNTSPTCAAFIKETGVSNVCGYNECSVHLIVKGAKVFPLQSVQTVDLLSSGPLLIFTQIINHSRQ